MDENNTSQNEKNKKLFASVARKNRLHLLFIGLLIFSIIFQQFSDELFPMYIFLPFLGIVLLFIVYIWRKQISFLQNGEEDEKRLFQKMVEKVEEKVSSTGKWEGYNYSLFQALTIAFFPGFFTVIGIFSNAFNWEKLEFNREGFFVSISFPSLVLFSIFLFICIFLAVFFVLRSYKKSASKTEIREESLFGKKVLNINEIQKYEYDTQAIEQDPNKGFASLAAPPIGKYFTLDVFGVNGERVRFSFSYFFDQSVEKIVKKESALFWVLQQIRKKKGEDVSGLFAQNTQEQQDFKML